MLDLKNNGITEEGTKMLAEARATGMGKKISNSCMAKMQF